MDVIFPRQTIRSLCHPRDNLTSKISLKSIYRLIQVLAPCVDIQILVIYCYIMQVARSFSTFVARKSRILAASKCLYSKVRIRTMIRVGYLV